MRTQHWSVWIHWDYMQMAPLITNQSHSSTVHLTAGWVTAFLNSCSRTEIGPLNLSDESRKSREEGKRFVFTKYEDTEINLESIYILDNILITGLMEYLNKGEISLWVNAAYCKRQWMNRWHVITLSHSERACPITRVKSSVQELRLPRYFAWLASRWDSRTKMLQGGSAVPWRSDFIGNQSQRYHLFKNAICHSI